LADSRGFRAAFRGVRGFPLLQKALEGKAGGAAGEFAGGAKAEDRCGSDLERLIRRRASRGRAVGASMSMVSVRAVMVQRGSADRFRPFWAAAVDVV
jgi:hypothetical protein